MKDIAAWCNISFYSYSSNPLYYAHHLYSDEETEITDLVIPNSVTSIGNYAFYTCGSLTSVTIPNSVTSIGSYAFYSCSGLTNIEIPNSVTSISEYTFSECSGLKSVGIPNSVTSIGSYAFEYCRGLKNVTIPNSVTEIGYAAFSYCSGLTNIEIPNSVTSIGGYAFNFCSGLTSVTIGNSVTSIGAWAFNYCSGLKKVIVKDIAAWCNISFRDNYSNPLNYARHLYSDEETEIKDLVIPNSVTEISWGAFYGCSGLASVTIPNSVTEIGNYAFDGCNKLTTLYSLNTTPPSVGSSNFTNNQYMTLNVYVPEEALEIYQSANTWKNFWYLQGFDATGIESVNSDAINGKNVYYDLNGNRLDAPKKGLSIINGKKVVIK